MVDLSSLVRENIKSLKPYSSARDEYQGKAKIYLDANENAIGSPHIVALNRYPDPQQRQLKGKIGDLKKIAPEKIFLGNGSDEAIDLLIRAFCEPGRDKIIIMPPTYGMYQVSAAINNVEIVEVPLTPEFNIDVSKIAKIISDRVHLTFVCSPNNPSGNLMREQDIVSLIDQSRGIVVVDEAYVDFSSKPGMLKLLAQYQNVVLLQTFSKAWGMASVRLGMAFADPYIIKIMTNIKPPYNINGLTQQHVIEALDHPDKKNQMVEELINQREFLIRKMRKLRMVRKIYPSEANFLLVQFRDSGPVFSGLTRNGIIVRDRSKALYCSNCLRLTVGTKEENEQLVKQLTIMDKNL